jgi:hypothetical protein
MPARWGILAGEICKREENEETRTLMCQRINIIIAITMRKMNQTHNNHGGGKSMGFVVGGNDK